jgi:hypothetical protein
VTKSGCWLVESGFSFPERGFSLTERGISLRKWGEGMTVRGWFVGRRTASSVQRGRVESSVGASTGRISFVDDFLVFVEGEWLKRQPR